MPADELTADGVGADAAGAEPDQSVSRIHVAFMALVHVGALAAPFWFTWQGLAAMLVLYVLTGIGITVGYHRLLAHRAFRTTTAVTRVFATLGVLAMQGGPLRWVADHRLHHFHSDTGRDPHDIGRGMFFAHMGWLFYVYPSDYDRKRIRHLARDLARDRYLLWLEKHHFVPGCALGALLLACGGASLFLWGFCARLVLLYHSTWLVNSACHAWGYRRYEHATGTNNWLVALLAFGEGWHNNHHAWPASARQGLGRWEVDVSWMLISLLKKLKLAWDVTLVKPDRNATRGGVLVRT
ncbi:MAG: fatty acid desaturase [Gammaproteobacteria bacterium]|nr:fatty acid desaturase [Gammaproteobacteria bacterium]